MRPLALLTTAVVCLAACAGSDGDNASTTDAPADSTVTTTEPPPSSEPPSTQPPSTERVSDEPPSTEVIAPPSDESVDGETGTEALLVDPFVLVEALASDELNGRDNLTDGSAAARVLLLDQLVGVVEPAQPGLAGDDGYLQPYDGGTNIVGILPGSGALAEEYVLVGAHYDHLGDCDTRGEPDDVICNGAADNATGVGTVISIVTGLGAGDVSIAELDDEAAPADVEDRRSVIVGLWDGEEDGLIGSQVYVDDPLVPLEQTVAYVNFDIQGAQLSPALANTTVLIGPETGGAPLVDAARRATEASRLDYATLSVVFGQGRSDHANFVDAGVPSVFFTDANNGCYHTVLDDIAHVDREKFYLQLGTARALVRELIAATPPPSFVPDAPLTTFADAVAMRDLVERAQPDFGLLPGDGAATATQFLVDLQAIVDAGPEAYDDAAAGTVLAGAAVLVNGLAETECVLPI